MVKWIQLEKVKKLLVASNTPSLEKVVISDYLNAWAIEVSEDCISRKWLEENAKEFGDYYENTIWAVPLSILDTAPSVVPKQSELTEAYTRGYKDGAEQTRAKGECPYFIDEVWCNLVGKEIKGADDECS